MGDDKETDESLDAARQNLRAARHQMDQRAGELHDAEAELADADAEIGLHEAFGSTSPADAHARSLSDRRRDKAQAEVDRIKPELERAAGDVEHLEAEVARLEQTQRGPIEELERKAIETAAVAARFEQVYTRRADEASDLAKRIVAATAALDHTQKVRNSEDVARLEQILQETRAKARDADAVSHALWSELRTARSVAGKAAKALADAKALAEARRREDGERGDRAGPDYSRRSTADEILEELKRGEPLMIDGRIMRLTPVDSTLRPSEEAERPSGRDGDDEGPPGTVPVTRRFLGFGRQKVFHVAKDARIKQLRQMLWVYVMLVAGLISVIVVAFVRGEFTGLSAAALAAGTVATAVGVGYTIQADVAELRKLRGPPTGPKARTVDRLEAWLDRYKNIIILVGLVTTIVVTIAVS